MKKETIASYREEAEHHLQNELLPFWLDRIYDPVNGGFLTHFDKNGNDSGEDEKSLIAQSRCLYTLSSAHRAGYGGGQCAELAGKGIDFLLTKMWDKKSYGFYWLADRKGRILKNDKILYGQSFAIYSLSEYTLATGDPAGITYAEKIFELLEEHAWDKKQLGYLEMFSQDWKLAGPGSAGGDRKTLDVHMHLMEAFTTLYECSEKSIHRQKLKSIIELLIGKFLHPVYKTGIPQFTPDWKVAPQIKFDIVWGWDRFAEGGQKVHAGDNTSFGHNTEFAWLLIHALDILAEDPAKYKALLKVIFDHTVTNGIDREYGGVYVEGPHAGGVYDMEKEFWQQAEVLIGMLDAYLLFDEEKYLEAYRLVHRFVFDKGIHHEVGEWWPLLTREGVPIWTHMSHSWKINYHSVRAMIQSSRRLQKIMDLN